MIPLNNMRLSEIISFHYSGRFKAKDFSSNHNDRCFYGWESATCSSLNQAPNSIHATDGSRGDDH